MDEAQQLRAQIAALQKRADEQKKRADEQKKRADEQKKRADEQKKRADEQKKRADEQKKRADEQKKRADDLEAKTKQTLYFEYLDNTHARISAVLRVETNPKLAATGKAAKVGGKWYPRLLRRWVDFPQLHRRQFDDLTALFGDKRLFPSYNDTASITNFLSPGKRRDEQDIRPYIRAYLELPSSRVVEAFLEHTTDPRYAGIAFKFSNNAHGTTKRSNNIDAVIAGTEDSSTTTTAKRQLSSTTSLAPDRWGQRIHQDGSMSDADMVENILPGEYKAVHKVRGSVFRSILGNQDAPPPESFMDDCAQRSSGGSRPLDPASHASAELKKLRQNEVTVAEVLCQAYHYMVVFENTYGYVTCGEASVFLMAQPENPDTLLYHFVDHAAVPVPITQPESDLVHVPAAQMTTLAILALHDKGRSEASSATLKATLPQWPKPPKDSDSTAADQPLGRSPPRGDDEDDGDGGSRHGGMPPPPPPAPSSGRPAGPADGSSSSDSGPGSGSGSGSGSRSQKNPWYEPTRSEYCTQACLLGLCRGGPLDPACPNVLEHAGAERRKNGPNGGPQCHAISCAELCSMLLKQFTKSMHLGLQCLAKYGLWGDIGTLFKVSLCGYGYTFVAKGVQDADAKTLKEEAALYSDPATQHLQGVLMPVYLGCIELEVWPFCLPTGAAIWHMMFLSWAGWSLERRKPDWLREEDVDTVTVNVYWELYRHGIYHCDVREANVAWNPELRRMMALDFDRAFIMTEEEYYETPPPKANNRWLGAAIPLENKFQEKLRAKAKLQLKHASGQAKPVAALPDAPTAEKRKHGGGGEDDAEQKRIRMN